MVLPISSAYVSSGQSSQTGIFSLKPNPLTMRDRSVSVENAPRSQLTVGMNHIQFTLHSAILLQQLYRDSSVFTNLQYCTAH